jgi:UDP-N-acetylmuramoyl-L-alanyl-D-glutamate--2,6-diaminopimelate ligase
MFQFLFNKSESYKFKNIIIFILDNINRIRKIDNDFSFGLIFSNEYLFNKKVNIFHDSRKLLNLPINNNHNIYENYYNDEGNKKTLIDNRINIIDSKTKNKDLNLFIFIKGSKYDPYEDFGKIYKNADILVLNFNEQISYNGKNYDNLNCFLLNFNNEDEYFFYNSINNKIFIHTTNTKLLYNFILKAIYIKSNFLKDLSKVKKNSYFNKVDSKKFIVGVTGTDGKTSVVNISRQFFIKYKKKAYSIGTLGIMEDEKEIKFNFSTPTSPEVWDLYKILSETKINSNIFVEFSSIGSETYRFHSLDFDGLVFTNMKIDHLDFHKTLDRYYEAKLKIIDLLAHSRKKQKFVLANIDDKNFNLVKERVSYYKNLKISEDYNISLLTYGTDPSADFYFEKLEEKRGETTYLIKIFKKKYKIKTGLIGFYNGYNLIVAIALYYLRYKKIPNIDNQYFDFFVKGRLEKISFKDNDIYIDYAHTENALEEVLNELRKLGYIYLITIFGCGGDRDKTKRPQMGKKAFEYSDLIIITSDNPRNEKPEDIIRDIIEGIKSFEYFYINGEYEFNNNFPLIVENINNRRSLKSKKVVIVEKDRRKAINIGVNIIEKLKNSCLLIAGKGHEDYQEINGIKYHFSDREEVEKILKLIK